MSSISATYLIASPSEPTYISLSMMETLEENRKTRVEVNKKTEITTLLFLLERMLSVWSTGASATSLSNRVPTNKNITRSEDILTEQSSDAVKASGRYK